MYFIYAIYNKKNNKIYIGQTKNLILRVKLHNDHIFINCYTSRFDGQWQLIYQEETNDIKIALKREKQLKSYRGREFIKQFIPE